MIFIDKLDLKDSKTKEAVSVIKAIGGVKGFEALSKKKVNALCLAMPENNLSIKKGFGNIGNVAVLETRNLNTVEILNNKYLAIVNPAESLKVLESRIK